MNIFILSVVSTTILIKYHFKCLICKINITISTVLPPRSALAYSWGTLGSEQFEEARPEFYGVLGRNKVTDRLEPEYPKWKRMAKFYCVSLPVVFFCLYLGFLVMLLYFYLQEKCDRSVPQDEVLREIGSHRRDLSRRPSVYPPVHKGR